MKLKERLAHEYSIRKTHGDAYGTKHDAFLAGFEAAKRELLALANDVDLFNSDREGRRLVERLGEEEVHETI